MTTTDNRHQVAALLERERGHLRDAYRAQRDALEAEFFGDEATCHNRMVDAKDATYSALVCAQEVADLMDGASDSAFSTGSEQCEGGMKRDGTE